MSSKTRIGGLDGDRLVFDTLLHRYIARAAFDVVIIQFNNGWRTGCRGWQDNLIFRFFIGSGVASAVSFFSAVSLLHLQRLPRLHPAGLPWRFVYLQ